MSPTHNERVTSWGSPNEHREELDDDGTLETPEDERDDEWDGGDEVPTVAAEDVDLSEATTLTPEQLQRVEALTIARELLLVSGFLGATPPLKAAELTLIATYLLTGFKDTDEDADNDEVGTDADEQGEQDGEQ